ncbi:MAG TPA: hypothetical protein VJR58_09585 [Vineibacter sp.]|nr:hypothetical protein [Vineibacter sp.]
MADKHISFDDAREQSHVLATSLDILMPKPSDGEANLLMGLEILTKVSIHAMVQKGWSREDAVVSLAAIITQVLIEGGPGGEALAAHIRRLASNYGASDLPPSRASDAPDGDALVMPDGVTVETAQSVAEVLDRLYPLSDEVEARYGATKHLVDQIMATMMVRQVTDADAVQTVLAAVLEVLVTGLGPDAAAAHLRRMAQVVEENAHTTPLH